MGEKNKQKCANKNICLLDENISYFSTLILLYFTKKAKKYCNKVEFEIDWMDTRKVSL